MMDYRYYIWSSYALVLLGLGWLLFDTLAHSKRIRKDLQERTE